MDEDAQDRSTVKDWNERGKRAAHVGVDAALGALGASLALFAIAVLHGAPALWLLLGPLLASGMVYLVVGGAVMGFSQGWGRAVQAENRVNRRVRIRQAEQEIAQLDRVIEQAER